MLTVDYNQNVKIFLENNKIDFYEDAFIFVDDQDEKTEKLIQDFLDKNNFEYIKD